MIDNPRPNHTTSIKEFFLINKKHNFIKYFKSPLNFETYLKFN